MLALACARAPRLDLMERFAELTQATLTDEMDLHRAYAAEWGVKPDELERESATATTRSYSDFLIRTASIGDYDELLASLLPCVRGYSELGRALEPRNRDDHPFRTWIQTSSSDEFAELARCVQRGAGRSRRRRPDLDRLREPFLVSSRFELAFWDMAWRLEPPLLDG